MIDNGRRLSLTIDGVFEGVAGENDGILALIPNRKGKRARSVRQGVLDGQLVSLTFVGESAPFVTYRYGAGQ